MLLLRLLVQSQGVCAMLTYRDLEDQFLAAIVSLKGVENRRKLVGIEFYCEAFKMCSHRSSSSQMVVYSIQSCWLSAEEFSGHSPSTTAPMTWWILPEREAASLAKRALEALKPVETTGLKALLEARKAVFEIELLLSSCQLS
ncbi:unnamed protein product [Diplocarpon coronariae]